MAKQQRPIAGQVVAITGGARGIGKATAKAFLAKGCKVAIGDLDQAAAEQTASELGEHCRAYGLNVCERQSVKDFLDATERDLGPIGIFVNNAGIMQVGWRIWEEDDATTQRMIDININGVSYGVKEVVPRMLDRRAGHVVNVASSAGKAGFPGGASYCGTKHYVVGLSEALRAELRGSGVEVSCVMPVLVNTELTDGCTDSRGVKKVEPEDVAGEIVSAVEDNRFDVFVPRSVARITWTMNLLPRRGREGVARALKADRVLAEVDMSKRANYQLRASQSDPGLEAGEQQKQLTS
ncbi:MAG: SDR family oxidoreductase [Baekduia sp.]